MIDLRPTVFVALGFAMLLAACVENTEIIPDVMTNSDADTDGDVASEPDVPLAVPCSGSNPCEGDLFCVEPVCVPLSGTANEATITEPPENKPTELAPNLSCVGATDEVGDGPETAALYGVVSRFGGGLKTYDIEVDVFLASDWDPSACESESASDQAGCYASYGEPLGNGVSYPVEDAQLPEFCGGHGDCPLGYECREVDLDHICDEQFGVYEIAGLPTNTGLVLRARATQFASKWHDTYVFGVVLHADQVDGAGRVHYDATMVSEAQWLLTPNTVGLSDIPDDRGAIGGRVRDCRVVGERAGWPIAEVSLSLASPAEKLVYFNNLEDDTVPLVNRSTTNIVGRFAALDVAPGWNVVAGVALVAGAPTSVGSIDVYVVPDALSIVSFPGTLPHWKQGWSDE
jgi:hypothetical protein